MYHRLYYLIRPFYEYESQVLWGGQGCEESMGDNVQDQMDTEVG